MVPKNPLTVVWISDFPVEWLADIPEALKKLPRRHPATWQIVLLEEYEKNPALRLHVVLFRWRIERDFSFERNGVMFHVLKASARMRLATFFWLDTWKIRRVCKQIQPDLVHAWGSEKGASLIASRLPHPYVMTIQGLFAWYRQKIEMPPYDRFVEIVERISLQRARVVTTESTFAVQFLKENFPKPQVFQAEHAPNPAFQRLTRRPATAPIQFAVVGGVSYRKGTDLLFAALDRLGSELDFKLKIITNPSPQYLDSIRSSISEKVWQRTEFKHHLLPPEVAAELETATMLLMPTRADTSPNAVKEAVVAGIPVVASSIGGIPDYVVPGKNGILFEPGNLDGFIQAIRSACAHPLFRKGQVEAETLTKEREYLSPGLMADKFLAAYEAAVTLGH